MADASGIIDSSPNFAENDKILAKRIISQLISGGVLPVRETMTLSRELIIFPIGSVSIRRT